MEGLRLTENEISALIDDDAEKTIQMLRERTMCGRLTAIDVITKYKVIIDQISDDEDDVSKDECVWICFGEGSYAEEQFIVDDEFVKSVPEHRFRDYWNLPSTDVRKHGYQFRVSKHDVKKGDLTGYFFVQNGTEILEWKID